MNKDIRKMCTRKKLLYKRAKSSGSEVAWQKFKECSNKVKALVRKSHKDYTYGISVNAKYNPKKFWSYISSLGGKTVIMYVLLLMVLLLVILLILLMKLTIIFCSTSDGIYINLLILVLFLIPQLHTVLLLFLLTPFLLMKFLML